MQIGAASPPSVSTVVISQTLEGRFGGVVFACSFLAPYQREQREPFRRVTQFLFHARSNKQTVRIQLRDRTPLQNNKH